MDQIGTTLSNLIKSQFPEHYRETGPIFVTFLQEYYKWLETQTPARDDWFVDKVSLVSVANRSANVVGKGTFFTTQFDSGDPIAISKGSETTDYEIFTVRNIANDVFLTLTENKFPSFNHPNTRYATVSAKPNALFLTRNFPELHDIDETLDQFVVYFKEKYLKNIQFKTITDTKTLVKHSLDLYRSKGTERSIDLLYKIAFGNPARIYYPGQDIFRLSSGVWFIPRYLELTLSSENKKLINREVVGVTSGATAFVEEIIRRVMGHRVIDVAYISDIHGRFITGEKVILPEKSLTMEEAPEIVGSLNELELDIMGSGSAFSNNELVDLSSVNGTGATGKVTGTSNTVGQLSYEFIDGGYGYSSNIQLSNTTGNVSVSTACTIVTGTGTLFQDEYNDGDYISIWSNSITYSTFQIQAINSNTSLTVNTGVAFTNAITKAAYTRYFAQTYVSEKILTISDVTINPGFVHHKYVRFLDGITQPQAVMNYENSNGTFTAGANIYTWSGGNIIGTGKILTVTRKTSTSGILAVSILSGDLNEPAIYTTANAIGANLAIANGYTDTTATARVIGNYANVSVTAANCTGDFIVGETIIQSDSGIGTLLSHSDLGGNIHLLSIDSLGIFKNGFGVTGSNSGATGIVSTVEIDVGVIDTANAFNSLPENYVYTDDIQGSVVGVSVGSGANVTFSNTILYPEQVSFAIDYISAHVTEPLSGPWSFPGNLSATLSSSIGNTLTFENLTIGKASGILATSPGTSYNKIPIVKLYEPTMVNFQHPDSMTLQVSNTAGFDVGEIITQDNSNARGQIMRIVNSEELFVQNMRFYANNLFVTTTGVSTMIEGADSGYVANIVSVAVITQSNRMGNDVDVDMDLMISSGAVTSVQVLDSGFGFTNGEIVTVTAGDKTATAFALLQTHGTGSGYYKTNDGFLSNTKKLSDGYYYQEYSYEVRSAVIDDFKKILKNIVHPAGTKYFDALVYDTINNANTTVNTTMTAAGPATLLLSSGDVLLKRDGVSVIYLGHP